MKKIIASVLALVLLLCAALAAAEEIDLSGLTNDDIMTLLRRVQEEMVARHIEASATLMAGTYTAGKDFPVGSYIYTCLATGDDWGNVTIKSEEGKGNQLFWEIVSAPKEGMEPESYFITVSDGDQLKSGVPFSLTIYTGVKFE